MTGVPQYPNPQAHIEARSMPEPNSGCWLWLGTVNAKGYGGIFNSAYPTEQKAHRVSYRAFVGDIPAGLLVCHSCDVPSCVNPAHLWLGTDADNAHDRDAKGRHRPRGRTPKPPSTHPGDTQCRNRGDNRMTLRDDLIAAKALIDTPEKWGRGFSSFYDAERLVRQGKPLCVAGACSVITANDALPGRYGAVHRALTKQVPADFVARLSSSPEGALPSYNDDPRTTHADIMALFDRAIEAAS